MSKYWLTIGQRLFSIDICHGFFDRTLLKQWTSHSVVSSEMRDPDVRLEIYLKEGNKKEGFPSPEKIWPQYDEQGMPIGINFASYGYSGAIFRNGTKYKGRFDVNPEIQEVLEFLLHRCLSFICLDNDELLLHASAVLRKGNLWLFSGPSRSGKTTIATELCQGGSPFSLDKVIVSINSDSVCRVYSTPFSDFDGITRANYCDALSGIALIEQSDKTEIFELSTHDKVMRVAGQSILHYKSHDNLKRFFDLVCKTVDSTACVGLKFEKNESFWALLDQI